MTAHSLTLKQRLDLFSEPGPNGCRIWTGGKYQSGHGRLHWQGRDQRAHRLAWIEANGEPPADKPNVLHNCPGGDNSSCIEVAHLWCGTQAANVADMWAKDRGSKGEARYSAKLTDQQAMAIFNTEGTQREIAARFGVNQSVISRIKNRKRWAHVHAAERGIQLREPS